MADPTKTDSKEEILVVSVKVLSFLIKIKTNDALQGYDYCWKNFLLMEVKPFFAKETIDRDDQNGVRNEL